MEPTVLPTSCFAARVRISKMSAFRHLLKWCNTVPRGGKHEGKCRHEQPKTRRYRQALKMSRSA